MSMSNLASPSVPRSTTAKIGGAVRGFFRGLVFSFVFLILGIGGGTFPIVGWALALGCVGAALIIPFWSAWAGYSSR